MALKTHHEPKATAHSRPGWGAVAEKGQTAHVVRFVLPDRSVSFPFHTLTRWEFNLGPPETLLISAAGETVTIHGDNLGPVRDALDGGTLLVLRAKVGRHVPPSPNETVVTGITFSVERQ